MRKIFHRLFNLIWPALLLISTVAHSHPGCMLPQNTPTLPPIALPQHPDNLAIANALGWEIDPIVCPLCGGYYREPLLDFSSLGLIAPHDTLVNADDVSFSPDGRSILRGHVIVKQPNEQLTADQAIIYRHAKTGKITKIILRGNVSVRRSGQLLIGQRATLYPEDQQVTINTAFYRLARDDKHHIHGTIKQWYGINGWGEASQINQQRKGVYEFRHVTYGTCPPTVKTAWRIHAERLLYDQNTGHGKAYDATVKLGNLPLLWLPYLPFSTNNQRKSGFLMPVIGMSKRTGVDLTLPYYFNLAPNYDFTFYPRFLFDRGVMLGGEFRYLTQQSHGQLSGDIIPFDSKFKNERLADPSLDADHNFRGAFSVQDHTQFDPHWASWLDVTGVSDDNYFKDFSTNIFASSDRQLLQEGGVSYDDLHWHFRGLVQHYQTLQPSGLDPVNDVYSRLPTLSLLGDFPQLGPHTAIHLYNEYSYFDWPKGNKPNGQRILFTPDLSLPFTDDWGFFTPGITFNFSDYQIHKQFTGFDSDITRSLPMLHIDTGLYFDREFSWLHNTYKQTLEPRLYYLWVPNENQTEIPLFDTGLYTFDFAQLFRPNRFSGYDRIGDANQLSAAVTSSILDQHTGAQLVSAGLGEQFYFRDRHVGYCDGLDCQNPANVINYTDPTVPFSPLVSFLKWQINPHFSLQGNDAWDFENGNTNNASINFQYLAPDNHILNLNYSFQRTSLAFNPDGTAKAERLQQIGISYAIPINQHWSTMGFWSYNLAFNHAQTYYFGAQYDSCCWALRVLGGRTLISDTNENNPEFNNGIYLQVIFKGLATINKSQAGQLLSTNIPGFIDSFK